MRLDADSMQKRTLPISFYAAGLLCLAVLTFAALTWLLIQKMDVLRTEVDARHEEIAREEIAQALERLFDESRSVARKFAQWDETRQQLTNPAYYTYWRQNRAPRVGMLPPYFEAVELYSTDGTLLAEPLDPDMPSAVVRTGDGGLLIRQDEHVHLYYFLPITGVDGDAVLLGHVGIKVNVLEGLKAFQKFKYTDVQRIRFEAERGRQIPPEQILEHVRFSLIPDDEVGRMYGLVYQTIAEFAIAGTILGSILLYLLVYLIAIPLRRLSRHIDALREDDAVARRGDHAGVMRVTELEKVRRSLNEYQNALQNYREHLEDLVEQRTDELTVMNKELESFSYSVSHDLRAPLRTIDGFSHALSEECGQDLNESGQNYLKRIRDACQRMAALIDDLLHLSRVTRTGMNVREINLSQIADRIRKNLETQDPGRSVEWVLPPEMTVRGDEGLLRVLLENLLGNAWKFTARREDARIELGVIDTEGQRTYYVRDNGAGFDMQYADKLFGPFQRLHSAAEFEGTGVGLATVQRIVRRHGGRVWAEGQTDKGATFYFTLDPARRTT